MPNQNLSAAVDAAALDAEWEALLNAVESDPDVAAEWSRVWASRDAQAGVMLAAPVDFCSQVMTAIANEKPLPSNVVAMPSRKAVTVAATRKNAMSWRTLVPLSAAAGIVAAVLTVSGLRQATTPDATAVSSASISLTTTPVSYSVAEAEPNLPDEAKAAILNSYLLEHNNSLADRSMGGALANARFAARTADYRPDSP